MMEQLFSASVLLAVIGTVPRAVRGWARRKRNFLGGLSDTLTGVVLAVSIADWLTPPDKPAVALLVGLVAGMVGAPAVDAAHEITPVFVRKLALVWARDFVRRADSGGMDAPPTVIDGDDEHG